MASGLGSPFDGRTPNPNSTDFGSSACSGGLNPAADKIKRNSLAYLFGSGWQNARNVALVVVESICIAALIGCLFVTYHSKYMHKGKRDKLRINSMRGAVLSTIIAVGLAISFIVLKTGYSCLYKGYYPYLYAVFGLGWRGAEIVTAAIIARTSVEQLRNSQVEKSERVAGGFSTWITLMMLATLASYVLYVLWMARIFIGDKAHYSTKGFGQDYARIDFGYQVGYLALSVAFLVAVVISLRQNLTPAPRRNLLLLITIPLIIREIEQVAITALITFRATNDVLAINLADALIYDITTTCIFFSLALLGKRDPNEVGQGAGSVDDSFQQMQGDGQPIGAPGYGHADSYEGKPVPQATTYAYPVSPAIENYTYYPKETPHF